MKKPFCDLCGEPADESPAPHHERKCGKPIREYRISNGGSGCERDWQTWITVDVRFGFRDHPQGFGGPPDLCQKCSFSLLDAIAQLRKPAKPKK